MTAEIVILAVEPERDVRLEQLVRDHPFAGVLACREVRDLVLEVALERLAELVVDARARRYLVAIVREQDLSIGGPDLDTDDARLGLSDARDPLVEHGVALAGHRRGGVRGRQQRPQCLVRDQLRSTGGRPLLAFADVSSAERRDDHPDQDEDDQVGEGVERCLNPRG